MENQAHLRIQPYTVHKEVRHFPLWICHIGQILILVHLHFLYTSQQIYSTTQKNTAQRFTVVSISANEDPLFISGSSSKHHCFSSPVQYLSPCHSKQMTQLCPFLARTFFSTASTISCPLSLQVPT